MKLILFTLMIGVIISCKLEDRYDSSYLTEKEFLFKNKDSFRLWIKGHFDNDSITVLINEEFVLRKVILNDNEHIRLEFENGNLRVVHSTTEFNLINSEIEKRRFIRIEVKINNDHFNGYMVDLNQGQNFVYFKTPTNPLGYLNDGNGQIIFRQFKYMPRPH